MRIKPQYGFTIIELLIVIAVIAVILAIAVPNYIRSREESHKNSCMFNMRQINFAIDQWVIENGITTGTVPSGSDEEDIYAFLKGSRPRCPGGGIYTIHTVGGAEQVTCSLSDKGHKI